MLNDLFRRSTRAAPSASAECSCKSEIAELRSALAAARAEASEAIAALRGAMDAQRTLLWAKRSVDLVDFVEIKVYMYTDDLAYQQVQERHRGGRPGPPPVRRAATTPESVLRNPRSPLFEVLFAHYWQQGLTPSYVDIGTQYGSHCIQMAQFFRACGKSGPLVAFEPGYAADLVPFNLRLNEVDDLVRFERCAVTDAPHPMMLFAELGHSENNRVVNRGGLPEQLSWVVPGESISHYVSRTALPLPLILKIDTQGGEYEVLRGMGSLAEECCMVLEFTPDALGTRVDPAQWLKQLLDSHVVVDLADQEFILSPVSGCLSITSGDVARFTKEVRERASHYTDLLALPRSMPALPELLARLAVQGNEPAVKQTRYQIA